jgi:hypothetical protein
MLIKIPFRLRHKEQWLHGAILSLLSLGIGIYLLVSMVIIAKDSVLFIQYAQRLPLSPCQTMLTEYQHPGYPFLIFIFHSLVSGLISSPFYGWILSAQTAAVFFKTLAVLVLYLWGNSITDSKASFWGVIIFLFLPLPAEYGSDALSDWPALFFLVSGLFCLHTALRKNHLIWFAATGLLAGIGYLIRPEIIQLVIYSTGMALYLLLLKKISFSRCCIILLIVVFCFSAFSAPYMYLKKSIFPKKTLLQTTLKAIDKRPAVQETTLSRYEAGMFNKRLPVGLWKLVNNLGETYMWYFSVFWVIGMVGWFKQAACPPGKTLVSFFISLNAILLVVLYVSFGYMSDRHSLGLYAITFPFVPLGIREICRRLENRFATLHAGHSFYVLILIGVMICIPKLATPIRVDKQEFADAALWLLNHAADNDMIIVEDSRIGFYSQKKWSQFNTAEWEKADWIVYDSKKGEIPQKGKPFEKLNLTPIKIFNGDKCVVHILRVYHSTKQDGPSRQ